MTSSNGKAMALKNHFDLSRFWLLLKMELFKSRKGVLMTFVIVYGMLFFLDFLLSNFIDKGKLVHEHTGSYTFPLIVGGFILSSMAFGGLGSSLKRHQFLTLPVSSLERFLCMWLLTTVGWIASFTIAYSVYAVTVNQVGQAMFNNVTFRAFEPFGANTLTSIRYYFALQGIFLAGAVYSKGYALPKTLFALVVFFLICGVLTYLIMKDVFLAEHECNGLDCILLKRIDVHPVWAAAQWMFWWVLAPLTWVATYVGLNDQEV